MLLPAEETQSTVESSLDSYDLLVTVPIGQFEFILEFFFFSSFHKYIIVAIYTNTIRLG